jgi:hypothetical protein
MSDQSDTILRDALGDVMATIRMRKHVGALRRVLLELEEYFEDRADVIDGDYGQPRPNREMQLLTEIKDALRMTP